MTADRRTLLALFSIAFGLRILFAAIIGTQPGFNPNLVTSSARYAQEISSGFDWVKEPVSPQAPGYPMLLSIAFLLSGGRPWAGIILQAILGALTVIVVYRLGEKLGGKTCGAIAAIWLSLYANHILFANILLRDILACLLLVLLIHLLARPFSQMRYATFSSLVYAALVHVEPLYLLLFPAIAVFLLVKATRHALLNLQYFFLFTGFLLILSLPWTIRNYAVYRQPIPISLEAVDYLRLAPGVQKEKREALDTAAEGARRMSRIQQFRSNTVEFWRVTRFRAEELSEQARASGRTGEKAWSLRHNLINMVSYGLLLPLFALGIIFAIREKNRVGLVIAATTFIYCAIRVWSFGSERARLPVEPFIILLAFYAVFQIIDKVRKQPTET
ncbi:MAG: hypothetical protein GTO51_01975 [Candidatus Latescibacteria bacterium]|nr:hypothetical protein [Candidatus Latescibacterota bacterium]NIM64741.1 hypothetical protein [Candidatus Latescibacterota bacterium]NIO01251.1 hypothetical protein [Candidatus Latescibacterota bacterium]NIO27636.1 hypothetical protein [Candidatus Latescibacterota bacterium]NIO55168.1 hypothetical protein [Candidatus Latescibacterota bacterium]